MIGSCFEQVYLDRFRMIWESEKSEMRFCRIFLSALFLVIVLSPKLCLSVEKSVNGKIVKSKSLSFASSSQESMEEIFRPLPDGLLKLDDCIDIALERNQRRTVSAYAVQIAHYQHDMALSSFWPSISLNSNLVRMDEDPNFDFNPYSPADPTGGGNSIPGMGGNPFPLDKVRLMDRDSARTSLDAVLPIYTGGVRSSLVDQAKFGMESAKEMVRRADLEVVYDVQRMYYGLVLAKNLLTIGQNSLERLQSTLSLTEAFYLDGSGRVTKTDYLRNKIIVETIQGTIANLESHVEIAQAALVNTMGLSWDTSIAIQDTEIPFVPCESDLRRLVSDTYQYNPDWKQFEAALGAAKAKIREEKGNRYPQVALFGSLSRWENSYDAGLATQENKESWDVGIRVQVPLFRGFLTINKIKAAQARLQQLQAQQILLKEGLALNVKHLFLLMSGYQKQEESYRLAKDDAAKNRELNEKAYQNELCETKDVIESQLMESFIQALYQKVRYDYAEARFQVDFVVGDHIQKQIAIYE